jgi:hypothetical protein
MMKGYSNTSGKLITMHRVMIQGAISTSKMMTVRMKAINKIMYKLFTILPDTERYEYAFEY